MDRRCLACGRLAMKVTLVCCAIAGPLSTVARLVEGAARANPAVDLIYLAAEDWAMASRWQPGPSDA